MLLFIKGEIKDPFCCESRKLRQLLLEGIVSRAGKGGEAQGRAKGTPKEELCVSALLL